MIDAFVSRPNWAPPVIEHKLADLYHHIEAQGFRVNTVGKTQAALRSPFGEMRELMERCSCTIVLGLPHIFVQSGRVKHGNADLKMTLSTEWNQIEATASLMLNLPTLVLLHKTVAPRGIFHRGAADLFVYDFDVLEQEWVSKVQPALQALRKAADSSSKCNRVIVQQ
jgi:hypothetical protein